MSFNPLSLVLTLDSFLNENFQPVIPPGMSTAFKVQAAAPAPISPGTPYPASCCQACPHLPWVVLAVHVMGGLRGPGRPPRVR
jgi:hypothetical protein